MFDAAHGVGLSRLIPRSVFPSGALRIADEDIVHTIVDFLSYLKLKGGRGSELSSHQGEKRYTV